MNKINTYALLISTSILMTSCYAFDYINNVGSFSGGNVYKFNCKHSELLNCINQIYIQNPQYKTPIKWGKYDNWNKRGYSFMNGTVFYFQKDSKNDIEDLYYIAPIGNMDTINLIPSHLAIRAVLSMDDNVYQWKYLNELSNSELERVEDRFQKEIIAKITSDSCGCTLEKVITDW